MSRRSQSAAGEKPALLALIAVAVIFLVVVGRGWQTLFWSQGLLASTLLGGLVAIIALTLAYAIGSERVHKSGVRGIALAYFFFLFNISALGTINAMFVMFQSSNVFRDEVQRSLEAVVALRDSAVKVLDTSDYDKFRISINEKWRNLRAELENPALCGQGPVAAARIAELQAVLPSFRLLAGSGRCERIPALVAAYEKQVDQLEKESPTYLAVKPRLALKSRMLGEASAMVEDLNKVAKDLTGAFAIPDIKARLFDVSEHYSVLRQEVASLKHPDIERLPLKIDMRAVSALGDIGQVLPFIVSRMSEVSTYIYLVLALVVDLAVIVAFTRVIMVGTSDKLRRSNLILRKV